MWTQTERNIQFLINCGIVLITAALTLRAMWDFIKAANDPETGLKDAFKKTRKRIFAAIIAITIQSTISFIQYFYG